MKHYNPTAQISTSITSFSRLFWGLIRNSRVHSNLPRPHFVELHWVCNCCCNKQDQVPSTPNYIFYLIFYTKDYLQIQTADLTQTRCFSCYKLLLVSTNSVTKCQQQHTQCNGSREDRVYADLILSNRREVVSERPLAQVQQIKSIHEKKEYYQNF